MRGRLPPNLEIAPCAKGLGLDQLELVVDAADSQDRLNLGLEPPQEQDAIDIASRGSLGLHQRGDSGRVEVVDLAQIHDHDPFNGAGGMAKRILELADGGQVDAARHPEDVAPFVSLPECLKAWFSHRYLEVTGSSRELRPCELRIRRQENAQAKLRIATTATSAAAALANPPPPTKSKTR